MMARADTEPAAPERIVRPGNQEKWDDEMAELAKARWKAGASGKAIGDEIGKSRSAVMGKLHRMGLRRHQQTTPRSAIAQQAARATAASAHYKQRKRAPWSDVAEIKPEITPTAVGIVDLERHHCRWPVSGEGAAMRYCGGNAADGYPYCSRHCRMAYQRAAR